MKRSEEEIAAEPIDNRIARLQAWLGSSVARQQNQRMQDDLACVLDELEKLVEGYGSLQRRLDRWVYDLKDGRDLAATLCDYGEAAELQAAVRMAELILSWIPEDFAEDGGSDDEDPDDDDDDGEE